MNNKYRNNNTNNNTSTIFSLNYKFDSNSIAGKYSGTALELIKRYNDLAKDAHNNNDYVNSEIFRQYAEHYRKIVTEINERKNSRMDNSDQYIRPQEINPSQETPNAPVEQSQNIEQETQQIKNCQSNDNEQAAQKPRVKKAFKVIEISTPKAEKDEEKVVEAAVIASSEDKPKRQYRRKLIAE